MVNGTSFHRSGTQRRHRRTGGPAPMAAAAVFLMSLVAAPLQVGAEPVLKSGKRVVERERPADTPQAAEHRAGVQALLKKDLPAAQSHFEASLKADPKYAPALVGLAGVAQAQGKSAEVEKYLTQADQVAPRAVEVKVAWGRYHAARGEAGLAEADFKAAIDIDPRKLPPLLELGDLYLRQPARKNDALRTYRQAVALAGDNRYAQYGLGAAAANAGQTAEALAAFEKAAQLAPQDPAPWRAIGRMHLEAGQTDKALAAFDAGIKRAPRFLPILLDRADALGRAARWADAAKQLQEAATLAPRDSDVQVKLGDVYQGSGRWTEAEAQYIKAIELEPRNPMAYNNLAWMTVTRGGDAKKAVEWARQATKLSPGSSPFLDTQAWAERASGDLAAATVSIKKAIELEPQVAGYHYHLGVIQAEGKQTTEARQSLSRALELDPRLPEADDARKRLKALGAG